MKRGVGGRLQREHADQSEQTVNQFTFHGLKLFLISRPSQSIKRRKKIQENNSQAQYVGRMKTQIISVVGMLCALGAFAQGPETIKAPAKLEPKSDSNTTGTVTFTKSGDEKSKKTIRKRSTLGA